MRGEASGNTDALGGGPATRSLMELDIGGRTSRNSGNEPVSAGGRSYGRPGSGLGRPVPGGRVDTGIPQKLSLAANSAYNNPSYGGQTNMSGGLGDAKGHKSKHSLAGTMGKFASGIARGSGSRDRKADDKKDKDRR